MTSFRAAGAGDTSASCFAWFAQSVPWLLAPLFGAVVVAGASLSDRPFALALWCADIGFVRRRLTA